MRNGLLFIVWFGILLLLSCNSKSNTGWESPIYGEQTIYCDRNLQKLILQQEDIFEKQYKYAKVNLEFADEEQLIRLLLKDSADVIIISRSLTSDEKQHLNTQQVNPRQWEFGTSAIALVTSKETGDSTILYEEFIQICKGNTGTKKYNKLVFTNIHSGIARYVVNLAGIEEFGSNVFALNDLSSVVEYIVQNRGSIGLIDWSELSDSDDSNAQRILSTVQLVGISRPVDSLQNGFLLPYQYNLQDHAYPLTRDLFVISRSGQDDIGLGFASFIAGDIGQKIILKAGLLPKYQSERTIELKDAGVRVVE